MLILSDTEWWIQRPAELERALRRAEIREGQPHPGVIGIGGGRARVENDDLERYSEQENVVVVVQPGWYAEHVDELIDNLREALRERDHEREEPEQERFIDLDGALERERERPQPELERDRERDRGIER